MVAKETKKKMSLLAAYVCMMSVATVSRAVTPPGRELKYNSAVAVLFTLAAFFPLQPVVLGVALCVRIVAILCSMPYVHDAQYWCMLTDATLLVSLLSTLMRRVSDNTNTNNNKKKKKNLREQLAALDASEATTVIRSAAATIRIELILLYTAAALWKANEGFLHPRFSCAPIYMMQLVEQWLPADLLASPAAAPLLAWQTAIAPALILAVETATPALLLPLPRAGVAFAGIFHTIIAITPPPNTIATFGTQMLPRLLLLVPDESAAAEAVASVGDPRGFRGLFIVGVAAITAALQPLSWTGDFDINVPICGGMAAIVSVAAVCSTSSGWPKKPVRGKLEAIVHAIFVLITVVNAFVVIPLGICDMGTANMFSSLRMHGGSNHAVLPTGLMQQWFADFPPDTSVLGNAFGGGIVRIAEGTNCSHITGPSAFRYPGELLGHTAGAVDLLVRTGHSGRQWSPMTFSCAAANKPPVAVNRGHIVGLDESAPFDPYTLPAPELRRILRDARARYPLEDFDVVGALLPGVEGDEKWRAFASAEDFVLRRRIDRAGNDSLVCLRYSNNSSRSGGSVASAGEEENSGGDNAEKGNLLPCSASLERILLTPLSDHIFARFMRWILLSQPYPILAEDAKSHRRLHCFGP